MPTCKACQREVPKLVRCHIYPESMSREAAGDPPVLVGMSNRHGPRASIANNGLFDDNIVCLACEKKFHAVDDYAIRFRRNVLSLSIPFALRYGEAALPTFTADPSILHSFAMFTLYRSYLSERWEHDQVHDTFIEREVRAALDSGQSTIHSGREICIVFTRHDIGTYLMAPHLIGGDKFPRYVLQMPNMTMYVDAGAEGLGHGFSSFALRPGNEVTVWRRRRPVSVELRWANQVIEELGDRPDRIFAALSKRTKA